MQIASKLSIRQQDRIGFAEGQSGVGHIDAKLGRAVPKVIQCRELTGRLEAVGVRGNCLACAQTEHYQHDDHQQGLPPHLVIVRVGYVRVLHRDVVLWQLW